MKTLMAGPDGVHQPGDVIDIDDATGDALIAGGYAEADQGAEAGQAVQGVQGEGDMSVMWHEISSPQQPVPFDGNPHR